MQMPGFLTEMEDTNNQTYCMYFGSLKRFAQKVNFRVDKLKYLVIFV